ncbi:hypothetical protein HanRHA438_Chr16g0758501 [Helianthus annuus]|nr:hypothetical protein HanRHA438_Chr16g0758501 [Helianthus annuus]
MKYLPTGVSPYTRTGLDSWTPSVQVTIEWVASKRSIRSIMSGASWLGIDKREAISRAESRASDPTLAIVSSTLSLTVLTNTMDNVVAWINSIA